MFKKTSIAQIYQHYFIPDNLATHMFQTAALGKIIIENWKHSTNQLDNSRSLIDQELTITTLLVHDLGNLVKFNLKKPVKYQCKEHKKLFEGDNLKFWQTKQQEMIDRYSPDASLANLQILKELNLIKSAQLLKNHTFEHINQLILKAGHWQEKIISYCDLRFTPKGLSSVTNRIKDLQTRYQTSDLTWKNKDLVKQRLNSSLTLEQQINSQTKIDITQVTTAEIDNHIEQLQSYPIRLNEKLGYNTCCEI